MRRFRMGGALLALAVAAGAAHAGLPIRNDEGRPTSVTAKLKELDGFVPADVKSVWSRFVDSADRYRGSIPRPAVRDPKDPPRSPDLGDGFLRGFQTERGLRRKLTALSGYLATLGRARRWISTLPGDQQQALLPSFRSLDREARTAESILVHQLGDDLTRGGGALSVVIDHVERAGYTEATAADAFGGLARGLKMKVNQLSQESALDQDARESVTRKLQVLERLLQG